MKFKYFVALDRYENWLKNTKWYMPILIFYLPFLITFFVFFIIGNYFPYNKIVLLIVQILLLLFVLIGYPFIKKTIWYALMRPLSKLFQF